MLYPTEASISRSTKENTPKSKNIPQKKIHHIQYGVGSFYQDTFHGKKTSSGEMFDQALSTAAHLTLPLNTFVKVTNLENGKFEIVRINDRGPFIEGRIIDLTRSTALKLGFLQKGTAPVKIETVDVKIDSQTFDRSLSRLDTIGRQYYKLVSSKLQPQGYGVQVASHKELDKIFELSEELEGLYSSEFTIEICFVNSIQVYRIILGSNLNKEEASKLKNTLSKQFPNCFVVKLG